MGMSKKLIATLLLCGVIVASFASCAGGDGANTDTSASDGETTTAESVEETTTEMSEEDKYAAVIASIPSEDYDGYEFKIAARGDSNGVWKSLDITSEGENGEPINDAVYERNRLLEEKLNVKVVNAASATSAPNEIVTKAILASEDAYDVVSDGLSYLSTMALNEYLVDYNDITAVDLDNEWWDQELRTGLSIKDRIYYATGDISIMDNTGTWCVLFNKDISTNLGLDDQYELVKSGAWTLDKLHANATEAALDLDGDGAMTGNDQYGFLSEWFNTYALWVGADQKIISKDADDIPVLSLYNDRSATIIEDIIALQTDEACTAFHNKFSSVIDAFKNNQGLYFLVGMRVIPSMRDMDTEFGIIPAPKYNEAQDDYRGTYSFTNFVAYSVPATASDIDRTGVILEVMAGVSKYTLTPAYYDTTLISKLIRDNESEEMIEIILSHRSFDLGSIFNFGKTFSLFDQMTESKSADIASRYAAVEDAAQLEIDEFIASLK